jgi:hypothetical protein
MTYFLTVLRILPELASYLELESQIQKNSKSFKKICPQASRVFAKTDFYN